MGMKGLSRTPFRCVPCLEVPRQGRGLPTASDRQWLRAKVTLVAADITASLKHLRSRSEVVRFDVGSEAEIAERSTRLETLYN